MTEIKQRIRIGWMSHHVEGVKPLKALLESNLPVECIITLERDLLEKKSGAVDYSSIARKYGVDVHFIRNVNDPASLELLSKLDLDVLFVIGWSQIIRKEALGLVNLGCFGAHASLLPENRGSAPVNWALIKGYTRTGNTLMKLSEAVDGGDIVDQRAFEITSFDNVATLYDKVEESNSEMILRLAREILAGNTIETKAQEDDGTPLLPRRRPQDGLIDWAQPASAVYDFIRALTRPYPGAFCFDDGEKYTIWRSALLPLTSKVGPAGTTLGPVVSDTDSGCGMAVSCGTGAIVLLEIEDEGGNVWSGEELASAGFANEWASRE